MNANLNNIQGRIAEVKRSEWGRYFADRYWLYRIDASNELSDPPKRGTDPPVSIYEYRSDIA